MNVLGRYIHTYTQTLFNHGNLTHYTKNALLESHEDKKLSLKSKITHFDLIFYLKNIYIRTSLKVLREQIPA